MRNYNQVKITDYNIIYYLDNKAHRTDGPAYICYYYNTGQVEIECYCINGKRHRTDGPAFIGYKLDGIIHSKLYYLNGECLPKEKFDKQCETITK